MYPETKTYLINHLDELFKKHLDKSISEENERETLEHLKKFILNYRDYFVFDKVLGDYDVDITYYKYSFEHNKKDKDGYPNYYAYSYFLLEENFGIHPNETEWKTMYTLYGNNNCDRGCCKTWEIFSYIENEPEEVKK